MRVVSKLAIAVMALSSLLLATPAQADVVRQDHAELLLKKNTPIYMWRDPEQKPRAVAVAIHGLTMHGGVYDALARKLAGEGIVVLAPDLRGYGRWQRKEHSKEHNKECKLNYDKSYKDVTDLLKSAKELYPNLPLYCIGESLGAGMALHAASDQPNLIDGLILSSPALKHRFFLGPILNETPGFLVYGLLKQINLIPYIRKFASEDPRIIEESLQDPLVRKKLTMLELLHTCNCMRPNLDYAKRIPASMPILVIQGNKDRMLRSNAVVQLLARVKSTDQTVRWFNDRGHLLLETGYLRPETLATVTGWLHQHIEESQPTQVSISDGSEETRFVSQDVHAEMANN